MLVVLNALFLVPGRVGGSETYVRGLVEGLAETHSDDTYVLLVGPEAAPTFAPRVGRCRIVASPVSSRHRPQRLLLEQTWLPIFARLNHARLIHSTGYTAPLVAGVRTVTSILDMNYKHHPEDFSPQERLAYGALIPSVAKRSDHVITLSHAARQDILRWTGIPRRKVSVVPLAPRRRWPGDPAADAGRLRRAGLSSRYILSVAASYPHKNLGRLIAAFAQFDDGRADTRLVLVGLAGRAQASVRAAALGCRRRIDILGWVDDVLLGTLYRNALALAFPSLYEGFGLPILEAMALGTPVVTSRYGAMAETAGDAAELVDPRDLDDIRRGLTGAIVNTERRDALRRQGLQRAREFSWQQTAALTRSIYQESGQ